MSDPGRFLRFRQIMSLIMGITLSAHASAQTTLDRSGPSDNGLAASVVVSGRVVNGLTGAPIARVLVQAGSEAMLTDRDGQFHLAGFALIPNTLQVTKPGYGLTPEQLDDFTVNLSGVSDRSSIQVPLYPEGVILGTVLTTARTPLPNVLVTVRRILFTETGQSVLQAARLRTDFEGGFRAPVPAGRYVVEVEAERAPFNPDQIIYPAVLPEDSESVTQGLSVASGAELRVTLTSPIAQGYTVSLTGDAERQALRIVARSSKGLLFPLGGGRVGRSRLTLPDGSFTLEATGFGPAGEQMGQATVTVAGHDVLGVVMPMSPVPLIPIELTAVGIDAGGGQTASVSPPSAQQMSLSLVETPVDTEPSAAATLQRMPDGSWVFRAPPGRYRLHAAGNSAWYATSATYGDSNLLQGDLIVGPSVGAATMRIQVSNQTGSLNGAVRLSGVPAAGWIYLVKSDATLAPILVQRSTTDGTFTFAYVAPGDYRAVAFEHKHSANLLDPKLLGSFGARVATVSIRAGERSSISLDVVPTRELLQP